MKDEAIKKAGEILIEAFPKMFGSITFNLQGSRKSIHANVEKGVTLETESGNMHIDVKESKQL